MKRRYYLLPLFLAGVIQTPGQDFEKLSTSYKTAEERIEKNRQEAAAKVQSKYFKLLDSYAAYAGYRERTEREIPIVILARAPAAA